MTERPHSPARTVRLFFAAWPEPAVQEALHEIASGLRPACGGRATPLRNIHLTLAFLGDVGIERARDVETIAAATGGMSCDLRFERLGYWRHNRIVWAGVERCPDALRELAGALGENLRAAGFRIESRPYVPHVTLLRGARAAPAAAYIPPIGWRVDALALVQSVRRDDMRRYEVLGRWQLGS